MNKRQEVIKLLLQAASGKPTANFSVEDANIAAINSLNEYFEWN